MIFRIVFVDAGVAQIDIETKKMKEEQKMKEAQARAVAEHGELALITVEGIQSAKEERIALRPPMLQVTKAFNFVSSMKMIANIQRHFCLSSDLIFCFWI